jgi:endonuclease I
VEKSVNNHITWPACGLKARILSYLFLLLITPLALAQAPAGYYDSVDTSSPSALRNTLHQVIDDHTRYPYTSTAVDTWDVLEIADENIDNAAQVITVYENDSNGKQGGGNSFYNREHSWPKSYGFPNDGSSNYPYTDMHHLFIADSGYNSSRSNKPFDVCTSGCSEKVTLVNNSRGGPGHSNWTAGSFTQGAWEVWDSRRGDIARAMFYMDVRYEGGNHGITGHSEPDLILTDNRTLIDNSNTGNNESVAYMGLMSVLILWHQQDPVDDIERQHNEAVASFQGNRNPFVDHPEWVECVFELVCNGGGGDTTPPATVSGLVASVNGSSVDLDWANNSETDLAGYTVYRSAQSGGPYGALNGALLSNSAYQDSTVSAGNTYYYVVTATDTSGNESGNSAQVSATVSGGGGSVDAFINEFHYDNSGTDSNEFVEIAAPAGTDVSGWMIEAYNGSNGALYAIEPLSGIIADDEGCMGVLAVNFPGLQNGSPDGLALVTGSGQVLDFISYEGTLTATTGSAAGMTSTDVGVSETSSTRKNRSLQLGGTGTSKADFSWQSPMRHKKNAINRNQTFDGCGSDTTPPAVPTDLQAIAGESQVMLSWNANSEADLAGYNVQRSTGGAWSTLNASLVNDIMYIDTTASNGVTYQYRITAEDALGNESAPSTTVSATPQAALMDEVWINELHYDNASTDTGEFVEIAGTAGTNLSGWQLVFYNGSNGAVYKTVNLSGTLPNQQNNFGTIPFDVAGIQNGAPDALALVNDVGEVLEFLSYEGTLTAADGPAAGMTSVNIGVFETSSTPVGYSLQKSGQGVASSDFVWNAPQAETYGQVNTGQSF